MAKTEQSMQSMENMQIESYSEKLEKAKKLYCLFNEITFGSEEDAESSRILLQQIQ